MGHTLVDASTSSANILIINPNAEEVVLPCRTSIGQLVHISSGVYRTLLRNEHNGSAGICFADSYISTELE